MRVSYEKQGIQTIIDFLSYLAAFDPDDIDYDEFEVFGCDGEGNEGSAQISIVNLAEEAVKAMEDYEARLCDVLEENDQLNRCNQEWDEMLVELFDYVDQHQLADLGESRVKGLIESHREAAELEVRLREEAQGSRILKTEIESLVRRNSLLIKEWARANHEVECLSDAIKDAAVKAGIVREGAFLSGPMLMMLCDDLASGSDSQDLRANLNSRVTECEFHGKDVETCLEYSGQAPCFSEEERELTEYVESLIEASSALSEAARQVMTGEMERSSINVERCRLADVLLNKPKSL